jgi:hypothetical protein
MAGEGAMGIGEVASDQGKPAEPRLAEAYRQLDDKRMDIDRRMTALAPGDPRRDILWQELEPVITLLRQVVSNLAKSPATQLPELRAKADVLASLLRGEGGAILPEDEKSALALSLTQDIARLAIG